MFVILPVVGKSSIGCFALVLWLFMRVPYLKVYCGRFLGPLPLQTLPNCSFIDIVFLGHSFCHFIQAISVSILLQSRTFL